MATSFPTSLDTLTNPTGTDKVSVVDHAAQHANANDAIEALQAKVGIDSSAVTTSHDYKLSGVTGSDKAVSLAGTETLTNKTLTSPALTTPKITTSINDANGNEVIETPATASAVNHVKITNATTGNDALIEAAGSDSNVPLTLKGQGTGKVQLGDAELQWPDADGSDTYVLKTNGSGVLAFAEPGGIAPPHTYSTTHLASDTFAQAYSDVFAYFAKSSATVLKMQYADGDPQVVTVTDDYAAADSINGIVLLGSYLYLLLHDAGTTTSKLFRYDKTNLAGGGTEMTIATQAFGTTSAFQMSSDGTDFLFNFQAGGSANDYAVSRYTLSGTTITHSSNTNLGSTANRVQRFVKIDSSGNFYVYSSTDRFLRKYNSSGTLQNTSIDASAASFYDVHDNNGIPYLTKDAASYDTFHRIYLPW